MSYSSIKSIDPEQGHDIVLTKDDLAQVDGGVVNMNLVEFCGKPTDSADFAFSPKGRF